ncbi:cytochrome P450 [Ideonella sp.]|uniref:cytochrome P450 n=1 Tax=Ideonella sp. TaxID=1929293 RepID=UPI0035B3A365
MSTLAVRPAASATPVDGAAPPRLTDWDSTLAFRRDPYRFIGRHAVALGTEVFEARLMLRPTLCLTGARAARLFYDPGRFERAGAAPGALQATLFGRGGVQGMDGAAHRRRKALFVALTEPAAVDDLVAQVRQDWQAAWPRPGASAPFSLYDFAQPVLTHAVCAWAGVPLPAAELPLRTRQLVLLFDGAAGGLAAHLRARWARRRLEAWLTRGVEATRAGRPGFRPGSAAERIARHGDTGARPLPARVAAVELLNLLRPVVAVSVYLSLMGQALHVHRGARARLLQPLPDAAEREARRRAFVQEVRRHYPFFPAVAARVRDDFTWQGVAFRRGQRALLDLYGTCHDARAWADPWDFHPQRFEHDERPPPFALIPQGGGDAATHHRCPGEGIASRLMGLVLQMWLDDDGLGWHVVGEPPALRMDRLPALPLGGLIVEPVGRPAGALLA